MKHERFRPRFRLYAKSPFINIMRTVGIKQEGQQVYSLPMSGMKAGGYQEGESSVEAMFASRVFRSTGFVMSPFMPAAKNLSLSRDMA